MDFALKIFVYLLGLYATFPIILFFLWEILGITNEILPNKYAKILLEFIFPENRENLLLKLLQKLYPFLF